MLGHSVESATQPRPGRILSAARQPCRGLFPRSSRLPASRLLVVLPVSHPTAGSLPGQIPHRTPLPSYPFPPLLHCRLLPNALDHGAPNATLLRACSTHPDRQSQLSLETRHAVIWPFGFLQQHLRHTPYGTTVEEPGASVVLRHDRNSLALRSTIRRGALSDWTGFSAPTRAYALIG